MTIVFLWTAISVLGKENPSSSTRVVALTNVAVEVIYELGLENHLVARTAYTSYPPAVKTLPSVGGMANPSVEKLLSFHSQVVFMPSMIAGEELHRTLEKFSVQAITLPDQTLEDFYTSVSMIARSLGAQELVAPYLTDFKQGLQLIAEEAAYLPVQTAILLYSVDTPYSAARRTWVGELMALTGLKNIVDTQTSWPQLKMEYLLQHNPEWIFFAPSDAENFSYMKEKIASLSTQKVWKNLSAVKNGQVRVLTPEVFHIPGPRMLEAARSLLEARR